MLDAVRTEDRRKEAEALARAVPVTRMLDYGVAPDDALEVHAGLLAQPEPQDWVASCEAVAQRRTEHARRAEAAGEVAAASVAWRHAGALLQCAQLALHRDGPRKLALYRAAQSAIACHARLSPDLSALSVDCAAGTLHGWTVQPPQAAAPAAVLVLGGLSGWGSAYLDSARALARRGLIALLGEGPGQGLTRMASGVPLRLETLPLLAAFLDEAEALGARRLGVWGNSFGGLLAAHLAVDDARVAAACINGAPFVPELPAFRTARDQMAAAFGLDDEQALAQAVSALALDPQRHRTEAPVLVVEGGLDPLLPLGAQAPFLQLSDAPGTQLLTWPDGEHTIYNHAAQRNEQVADWFARQLAGGP